MPDEETKWPKGPWVYFPIAGYQFVVMLENRSGGMKLIASGIEPGKEEQARAALTLAATAPNLYALVKAYRSLPRDPSDMQLSATDEWADAALAAARGEEPNDRRPEDSNAE